MVMLAGAEPEDRGRRLADPRLRRDLQAVVKRRVRSDDAEDIVQAAIADVLSAARVPEDDDEFRRFVFAVTRNKVFDHFRRRAREAPEEEGGEPAALEAPLTARDMLRWAEGKLPDSEAQHTLEWMLREGDGEKLEQIARDANVPAPRVRQRVSRLRRFLRERWAAELMLGALGLALLFPVSLHYYLRWHAQQELAEHDPILRPEPPPSPAEQGRELRRAALLRCEKAEDHACLEGLDRARDLDPQGDTAAEVVNARRAAAQRLAPAPLPVPSSSSSGAKPAHRRTPAPSDTESSITPLAPRPSFGSEK